MFYRGCTTTVDYIVDNSESPSWSTIHLGKEKDWPVYDISGRKDLPNANRADCDSKAKVRVKMSVE